VADVTFFLPDFCQKPTPHHINPRNQILSIMKYGVNRVTLVEVNIYCELYCEVPEKAIQITELKW